jgi:hypothetical protein
VIVLSGSSHLPACEDELSDTEARVGLLHLLHHWIVCVDHFNGVLSLRRRR